MEKLLGSASFQVAIQTRVYFLPSFLFPPTPCRTLRLWDLPGTQADCWSPVGSTGSACVWGGGSTSVLFSYRQPKNSFVSGTGCTCIDRLCYTGKNTKEFQLQIKKKYMKYREAVLTKPSPPMVVYILLAPYIDLRHWKYLDNLTASCVDTTDSDLDVQNDNRCIKILCGGWSTRYSLIIFCVKLQGDWWCSALVFVACRMRFFFFLLENC